MSVKETEPKKTLCAQSTPGYLLIKGFFERASCPRRKTAHIHVRRPPGLQACGRAVGSLDAKGNSTAIAPTVAAAGLRVAAAAGRLAENARMNEDKGARPRAIAAQVLDAVLHRGRSLKGELATVLPALADVRDRALVGAICFAALRQRAGAEAALRAWVPRPLGRRDGALRALLHAGFAQIDPLGLPPHAAVDATVGAARLLGRAHQRG